VSDDALAPIQSQLDRLIASLGVADAAVNEARLTTSPRWLFDDLSAKFQEPGRAPQVPSGP
jgi:hypothetical protein